MRAKLMRPEVGVSPYSTFLYSSCHLVKPCIRHLGCVVRLSKRPDNSRPSDGIDEAAYKELSPAAREAQENILALNGSRMRALQELRAANEKIAELEKRLEDATTQISKLATRHNSSSSTSALEHPEQHQGSTNSAKPRSTTPAASTSLITVSYVTGWDTAFLHFQIDDQPWTSLPGVPMENDDGTRKILSVPGNRMKFVVTNGLGKFDTPNPYGDPHKPKNYEINEPGCYILEAGNLRRL
ncbi:hypothetical protein KSW81_000283 [Nannochloris sp. 'desiccata']|nr:hypothetical protein KSW81_006271 [Chlorella desiccata (nom. nud.)]KAG7674638.1 hypothetical protein KSW81_000283 [Chlorella desiccata (nom. nud.)]